MEFLARRDYSEGVRLLRDLGVDALDTQRFARHGVERLPELVPSELTTLSVCDLVSAKRTVLSRPERALSAADRVCFDHFFREHPLVRYHADHRDGGTRKISDTYTTRQFRRTALYNEYYRRIGIDHAIAVPLFVDNRLLVSFVLNRTGRDFSERDRALLDLIRGPLANIYRQALALERATTTAQALREWITGKGRVSVAVDAGLRLREVATEGTKLLAHYCPGARIQPGAFLPVTIDNWLRRGLSKNEVVGSVARAPLRLENGGNRLTIHAFADLREAVGILLLLEEETARFTAPSFEALPLTPREREVLTWLAAGKTNQEIGAILGISTRTVDKHLEHLYVKLGVETRTAAVMRAIELARESRH